MDYVARDLPTSWTRQPQGHTRNSLHRCRSISLMMRVLQYDENLKVEEHQALKKRKVQEGTNQGHSEKEPP